MIRVTAAVVERDGRILIARRPDHKARGGKWEFPGGKIEPGETPEGCLARELREEFGVDVDVEEFIAASRHDYGDIAIELLAYCVRHVAGEWRPNEHERIEWVVPARLTDFDFAEADRPIVRTLLGRRGLPVSPFRAPGSPPPPEV